MPWTEKSAELDGPSTCPGAGTGILARSLAKEEKRECKRPKGAAALHNQIPRRCSRMRSTPMDRGGHRGGRLLARIPRAREDSEKCAPLTPPACVLPLAPVIRGSTVSKKSPLAEFRE
ncbi:hypothetical protein WN55_02570 [Dufourea novaeangliae]|uniref:Uncharacterized protein n=1 Tax=Dufourea novaeangliae TaxID=178035 RepID=A0A154PHK7_DUFNO|nr:hypothetical protein WN55_02570 [Dufourea novaeangliae]